VGEAGKGIGDRVPPKRNSLDSLTSLTPMTLGAGTLREVRESSIRGCWGDLFRGLWVGGMLFFGIFMERGLTIKCEMDRLNT
jgi:hypothetical protein